MKHILYIVVLLIVGGCYTKQAAIQRFCPTVLKKDSVVFQHVRVDSVVQRDSIVLHPATTTSIQIGNPCDSLGRLKTQIISAGTATSQTTLIVTDSGILCQSRCDSVLSIYSTTIQRLTDSVAKYQSSQQTTVQAATKFIWWPFWVGGAIGVLGIFIIKRIVKYYV
jgi:uncharacterized lipoprotein YajG